jgi:flagellar basal-body rod protein FlgF
MIRGLYTAAAGMLAQTVATDTMANNLANINTAGFKRNGVSFQGFPEMLMHRIQGTGGAKPAIGSLYSGSAVHNTSTNFVQGSLHQTGNPLDVGLQGDGFFTVKTGNGQTRYTRDGSFTLNATGELVTQTGEKVQGTNGTIVVPAGSVVAISPNGTISAISQTGSEPLGKLALAQFDDNKALQKVGNNLYQAPAGVTPKTTPNTVAVAQGSLESSNVNAVSELVNSITGLRLYEALEKNIHAHNDTLGKAVNEVGKVR